MGYTIDPKTRYIGLRNSKLSDREVLHLYTSDRIITPRPDVTPTPSQAKTPLSRKASSLLDGKLLAWCKKSIQDYRSYVVVYNMESSWRSGVALCALIHAFCPELRHLIDIETMDQNNVEANNKLAFVIAHQYLNISPKKTGKEMAEDVKVDKLFLFSYISEFYELFKNKTPASLTSSAAADYKQQQQISSSNNGILSKIFGKRRSTTQQGTNDEDPVKKKKSSGKLFSGKKGSYSLAKAEKDSSGTSDVSTLKFRDIKEEGDSGSDQQKAVNGNGGVGVRPKRRIEELSQHLMKQWKGEIPANDAKKPWAALSSSKSSEKCYFCREKVYLVQRCNAEGKFFHRDCFTCHYCKEAMSLRAGDYQYVEEEGNFYCCKSHISLAKTNNDEKMEEEGVDSESNKARTTVEEINPDEIKGEVGDDGGKKLLLPNKPSRFNFFSMVRMFKWTYYMITATVTTIRKSNTDWWRLFFLTLAFGFAHLIFI